MQFAECLAAYHPCAPWLVEDAAEMRLRPGKSRPASAGRPADPPHRCRQIVWVSRCNILDILGPARCLPFNQLSSIKVPAPLMVRHQFGDDDGTFRVPPEKIRPPPLAVELPRGRRSLPNHVRAAIYPVGRQRRFLEICRAPGIRPAISTQPPCRAQCILTNITARNVCSCPWMPSPTNRLTTTAATPD